MTKTTIEWVAVADQMPDDDCTVLLAWTDGDVVTGFHDEGEWRDVDGFPWDEPQITHWAHFPRHPAAP